MDGKRITSDMLRAMVMRERRRSKQVSTVDWFVQAERDARANPAGIQIALAVDEQDSQIPYEALDEGGSATGVASLNSDGISSAPIIHSAPSSPSHGPISPLNTALHTPPSSTVYTSVDTPRTSSPLITSSPLLNASTRQRRSSTIVRSDKSADSWPVRARHRLRVIWHAAQAWIVTALVGVTIGITCATVDTWTSWLLTLRSGVCHSDSIFLETQLCCPFIGSSFIEEHCKSFRSWSSLVLPYYAPSDTDVAWVYTLVNILSFCLLAVLMAGLGSWLTVSIAPAAAGSGIPEVKTILSGVMMDSALRPLVSAVKAVALALVVGAGLSVGKEGPYIHLAACIGHWFCSLFSKYRHSEARKRELLSAACACGVSVAFGSPLGGVLFAMEDLCTYFPPKTMWRTFFCAIIGCVTLGYLDLKQAGTLFLFNVRYDRQWLWFELPAFAVVGVVCGVVGAALVAVNIKVAQFRRRHDWLNGHPIREVCLIALATAGIKYYFSELHEDAYELLNSLFLDCSDRTSISFQLFEVCNLNAPGLAAWHLAACAAIVFACTAVAFGTRIPAGIFIPSMLLGSLIGTLCGLGMRTWQLGFPNATYFSQCATFIDSSNPMCISPAIYAMVGAASSLTGVTRLTVACVVIMFEVTGGVANVVPVMIGVMCAKWAGDACSNHNIAGAYIHLKALPFMEPHEQVSVEACAGDIMTSPVHTLHATQETVMSVLERLQQTTCSGFPIVTNSLDSSSAARLIVGYTSRSDVTALLERGLEHDKLSAASHVIFTPGAAANDALDLSACVDTTPIVLAESTPFAKLSRVFMSMGLRYCLVTRLGQLVGIVTRKSLYAFVRERASHASPDEPDSAD